MSGTGTQTSASGLGKSKRNVAVIQKVQEKVACPNDRMTANGNEPVDESVDLFIKMKLFTWDKDHNGRFTVEEVNTAMQELTASWDRLASMKWRFINLGLFLLFFVGGMSVVLAIVLAVTKSTSNSESGEMRAVNPNSKKPAQTQLVTVTQSRGDIDLGNFLNFDNTTDQWLIDDAQLRELDTVSFWAANKSFYHLQVAELIRTDSGPKGVNDKLEILTLTGVRLRVFEDVGELEVLLPGTNMWQGAPQPGGGRRMPEEGEVNPNFAQDESMMGGHEDEFDDNFMKGQPAERRLGKGGVVVFYGGAHHNRHGGSSNGCQGYCNVPWGTTEGCGQHCQRGACYTWGSDTYQCNDAAIRSLCGLWAAGLLLISRMSQD